MKAWEQISSNDDNRVFRTMNSSWYIDHGVKIECFDEDGRIEVMNVMTASDFHEPITDEQMYFFEHIGWEAGCYKVNVDTCDTRAKFYEKLSYRFSVFRFFKYMVTCFLFNLRIGTISFLNLTCSRPFRLSLVS